MILFGGLFFWGVIFFWGGVIFLGGWGDFFGGVG